MPDSRSSRTPIPTPLADLRVRECIRPLLHRRSIFLGKHLCAVFSRTTRGCCDVREFFYCDGAVVETAREYWKLQRSSADGLEEKEPHDITIDAIKEFVSRVRDGKAENACVRSAESTLTAILARTSMDRNREVTWKELMA